jgi:hypothetical protein
MSLSVFAIGHSTHPLDRFQALLAQQEINALVDIRLSLVGAWVAPTKSSRVCPLCPGRERSWIKLPSCEE